MTISIRSLTKSFEGRLVLDDVSLDLAEGAVTTLLGPSGCGKSTLLRCINGLESFEGGEIHAFGHVLRAAGDPGRAAALRGVRAKVGFVFQQWNLFAHRNALANVMEAPVHVKRVPVAEARSRAEALLARV